MNQQASWSVNEKNLNFHHNDNVKTLVWLMFENFPTTQIDNLNLFKVTKSNLKPLLVQNIQKLQNVFVLNTFHIFHILHQWLKVLHFLTTNLYPFYKLLWQKKLPSSGNLKYNLPIQCMIGFNIWYQWISEIGNMIGCNRFPFISLWTFNESIIIQFHVRCLMLTFKIC